MGQKKLVAGSQFSAAHHCLFDLGKFDQARPDFFQGDPVAADLHLSVPAANKLDETVCIQANEVSCPVKQPVRKSFVVEIGAVLGIILQVPKRNAKARDIQFPVSPGRTGRRPSSRMKISVPVIGRPMGTVPSGLLSFVITWQAVKVVFSVGPYPLITVMPSTFSRTRATCFRVNYIPLRRARRATAGAHPHTFAQTDETAQP